MSDVWIWKIKIMSLAKRNGLKPSAIKVAKEKHSQAFPLYKSLK